MKFQKLHPWDLSATEASRERENLRTQIRLEDFSERPRFIAGTNPVYVSPGHCMSIADATRIAFACAQGYRIPEPSRRAHLYANELSQSVAEKSPSPSARESLAPNFTAEDQL